MSRFDTQFSDVPAHIAADNGRAVKALMESEGWAVLQATIQKRLAFEQKVAMKSATVLEQGQHERRLGEWNGMEKVAEIAESIVAYGAEAQQAELAAEAAGGSR